MRGPIADTRSPTRARPVLWAFEEPPGSDGKPPSRFWEAAMNEPAHRAAPRLPSSARAQAARPLVSTSAGAPLR
jgi:hypothetical protein